MTIRTVTLALAVGLTLTACESELDDKTAAAVTPTATQTDTSTEEPQATTTAPDPQANVVSVNQQTSAIRFVGAKVTRDHQGQFHDFDGWIEYQSGVPAKLAFTIDLDSIETDSEKLTAHLKTPDFFDVARFPQATFVSNSITPIAAGTAGGPTHTVRGMLNMHGAEREVSFPVTATTTPDGTHATSEFTINRHDWGISYRGAVDDLIKDEVLIRLDLHFPPPSGAEAATTPAPAS